MNAVFSVSPFQFVMNRCHRCFDCVFGLFVSPGMSNCLLQMSYHISAHICLTTFLFSKTHLSCWFICECDTQLKGSACGGGFMCLAAFTCSLPWIHSMRSTRLSSLLRLRRKYSSLGENIWLDKFVVLWYKLSVECTCISQCDCVDVCICVYMCVCKGLGDESECLSFCAWCVFADE